MNRSVLLFALLGCVSAIPHHSRRPRVINGQEATPGQFPYAAALDDSDAFSWCSGAIIHPQWILTSADCVEVIFEDDYIMVGSVANHNESGTHFKLLQTIQHEEYDYFSYKNDIALIQIDGELVYDDNIQAIEIGEVTDNATCNVMGWGSSINSNFPITLQYAQETTIDVESCKSLANDDTYYLGDETICGLGVEGADLCWGDSGGPLVCDGVLVGIASFALADCLQLPDIFTRVAIYKDWIDAKIAGGGK